MLKSYSVFTSFAYKLIIWLLYHLLAIFGCVLVQNGVFGFLDKDGFHYSVATAVLLNGFMFVEIMSDFWLFSGIQSKTANHMDFLKLSVSGRQIFRNALIMDTLRRLITIVVCNMINVFIGVVIFNTTTSLKSNLTIVALYILMGYFLSALGVFMSRFGITVWINFGITYVANFFTSFVIFMLIQSSIPMWTILSLLAIANIVISYITIVYPLKKMEDSYNDK